MKEEGGEKELLLPAVRGGAGKKMGSQSRGSGGKKDLLLAEKKEEKKRKGKGDQSSMNRIFEKRDTRNISPYALKGGVSN